MYTICKQIVFDSSHRLWDDSLTEEENKALYGKCTNLPNHGHTYTCEIYLRSETLKHGMVVNFTHIKEKVMNGIIGRFDHHYLNDLMEELTTAENIAKLFFDEIKASFSELYKIRIWEGNGSWAEYQEN